jgi:hypothetical protein
VNFTQNIVKQTHRHAKGLRCKEIEEEISEQTADKYGGARRMAGTEKKKKSAGSEAGQLITNFKLLITNEKGGGGVSSIKNYELG